MFDENNNIDLKIPLIIIGCVLVLGGGIFIGINSNKKDDIEATNINNEIKKQDEDVKMIEDDSVDNSKTQEKNVFALSENCEIWLKNGQDENLMIGLIPKELLNKSEQEIRDYLTTNYPQKNIDSITYGQIVLSEQAPKKSDTIKNKYALEVENGLIGVYKYDINGNRNLEKETSIKIDLLPQSVQEQIQQGMIVKDLDEAYSLLENLSS